MGGFGFPYGWGASATERNQEAQGSGELARVANFEASESGEDGGVTLRGVGHGEVVHVLMRFEEYAVLVFQGAGVEGDGFVFEDGLFHEGDAERAPFGDGEVIDEVTIGEVSWVEVGSGGLDEVAEPIGEFSADGEGAWGDFEELGGWCLHVGLLSVRSFSCGLCRMGLERLREWPVEY